MRLFLAVFMALAAGCGLTAPANDANPSAREICAGAGHDGATIDVYFETVESGQANGLTKTEALDASADVCVGTCQDDTTCAQACISCLFAIVDAVY